MYGPADACFAIPHWEREEELRETLASIRSACPAAMVSVCDDGSRSPPPLGGCGGDVLTCLPRKRVALNPCVPINAAVARAVERREVVVLTNPGCVVRAGMLEALLMSLGPRAEERSRRTYVAAACRDADTGRWLCHGSVVPFRDGLMPFPRGAGLHFLALLHRDLWAASGGFDEAYRDGQGCEDNDFLWRLDAAGAAFVLRDDVVVDHRRSTTPWPVGGLARNVEILRGRWGNLWLKT